MEIPYYLKATDTLVLLNSEKTEILKNWISPIKIFEYMASKKPIIDSNLPSIREILNENNAILVNSDNSEDLAISINIALETQDFSDKLVYYKYVKIFKNILG